MKIGIIGLPQTGKKTLFELITSHPPSEKELSLNKPIEGIAEIIDPRFEKLVELYNPKKTVRARINVKLIPKLEPGSAAVKGDVFKEVTDVDVLCHIVRAFKDDSVYHIHGAVDPKRDIDEINSELILSDLLFIEKRLERIEQNIKKINDATVAREKELLLRLKSHLEKESPLRLLEFKEEEKKLLANYQFVTLKEMIIVLNVAEDDLKNTDLAEQLTKTYEPLKIYVMRVSAKVEGEIAKLESDKERKEFLEALGIEEPAIEILKRVYIKALNLISFFTVGADEVRQWTIRVGSTALKAAGTIHTDLERGFIRADVIKYDDLISLGSEEKAKESGKAQVKGKDYIVEDGNVLNIRFNV